MKITKEQLKQIIKEELKAVIGKEMTPDNQDYDDVTEAIFAVMKKVPGGKQHFKMILNMMPGSENQIYNIAQEIAEEFGVAQHSQYIGDKALENIRNS